MSDMVQLTQQALWLIVILAGPPVFAAALVGILIAFFQAVTQLQEQSFQYAMKFVVVAITIFVTASLMGSTIYEFSDKIFSDFPRMVVG